MTHFTKGDLQRTSVADYALNKIFEPFNACVCVFIFPPYHPVIPYLVIECLFLLPTFARQQIYFHSQKRKERSVE